MKEEEEEEKNANQGSEGGLAPLIHTYAS